MSIATGTVPPLIPKFVGEMARASNLQVINLVQFSGSVLDLHADDSIEKIDMEFSLSISKTGDHERVFGLGVSVVGRAKADPERKVGSVSCVYAAKYSFLEPAQIESRSQDELVAFGTHVAATHLWPFVREFISTTAQRMMIPPMVLPYSRVVLEARPVATEITPLPPTRPRK